MMPVSRIFAVWPCGVGRRLKDIHEKLIGHFALALYVTLRLTKHGTSVAQILAVEILE